MKKSEMPLGALPETLYSVYVPNKECNLNCQYCATGESHFLREIPSLNKNYWTKNNDMLAMSRRIYSSEILKIVGGGEIFLDKNLEKWVHEESDHYGVIFILTNGVSVGAEKIEALSDISNLYLGLSLDGHLQEMNSYRFSNEETYKKVIDTFHQAGGRSIPSQINMVMHDRNYEKFFDYLDFLNQTGYVITLHMSPVMPKNIKMHVQQQKECWIKNLEILIDKHQKYKNILLPKAYYKHLIEYYKNNSKRSWQCYIPYFMVQLFSTGNLTACPIVWNQNIGNVNEYSSNLFAEDIYKLLCREGKRPFFCRKCISSYDILSLYTNGEIEDEEIKAIPLFSSDRVFQRIRTIKEKIKGE